LSRMGDGVSAVLERYQDSRKSYIEMGDSQAAHLSDRHGGTLEQGYPEAPVKPGDGAAPAQAQALNAEAP